MCGILFFYIVLWWVVRWSLKQYIFTFGYTHSYIYAVTNVRNWPILKKSTWFFTTNKKYTPLLTPSLHTLCHLVVENSKGAAAVDMIWFFCFWCIRVKSHIFLFFLFSCCNYISLKSWKSILVTAAASVEFYKNGSSFHILHIKPPTLWAIE